MRGDGEPLHKAGHLSLLNYQALAHALAEGNADRSRASKDLEQTDRRSIAQGNLGLSQLHTFIFAHNSQVNQFQQNACIVVQTKFNRRDLIPRPKLGSERPCEILIMYSVDITCSKQ